MRDGSERGVGDDVGEVGHGGGQLHLEGVLVGAGDAGELLGVALGDGVVAHDGREVVGDLGGRGHLGVADALPRTLEALGVDGVAVVELGTLDQVEGPLGGVGAGLPGLGGLGDDLLLVPVVVGEGVEQDVLDLGALGLLGVVGIDGDGVIDVELHGATGSGTGAGTGVLLSAACEGSERTCGEAARDEGTTTHHQLIRHSFLLWLLRRDTLPRHRKTQGRPLHY